MGKQKNEIKELLTKLFALSKVKFLDVTLQDGSILRTEDDELKQGSAVTLVSSDGSTADAQDGEYTLSDGSKVVIKSGVIDSVTPAAPATPTSDAAETVADAKEAPTDATPADADGANLESITNILQNLVSRIENIEKKLSETSQSTAAMKSQVEKFLKEPVGKPINKGGDGKKEEIKMYTNEWFEKEKASYNYRERTNKELDKLEKNLSKTNKIEFSAVPSGSDESPRTGGSLELAMGLGVGLGFSNGLSASK